MKQSFINRTTLFITVSVRIKHAMKIMSAKQIEKLRKELSTTTNVTKIPILLKHSREKNHQHVWENDFKVLGNNYCSNFKRKVSEALFIKQLKPSLNVKVKSIQLQLYNWVTIPVASTCLKVTKYTLEQHTLRYSWLYHVKFEHVNVSRDIT